MACRWSATTAGAIPDTVPPDAGVLVPPDDAAALAGALRRLIENADERRRLAAGARQAARAAADLAGIRHDIRDCARGPHMSFSAQWLALREPYDLRARNPQVRDAVAASFTGAPSLRIVDLACGTGSTLARAVTAPAAAPTLALGRQRPQPAGACIGNRASRGRHS